MIRVGPSIHRYDRSLYPKSRLPGPAVCMFESEIGGVSCDETRREKETVRR